jgi:hypothetical protein
MKAFQLAEPQHRNWRAPLRKKRFGQRTPRRNSKYKKRATARIALTCLIGQRALSGVRIFYDFFGHA